MSLEKIKVKGRCPHCGWNNFTYVSIYIAKGTVHRITKTLTCEDCGKKVKISGSAKGK